MVEDFTIAAVPMFFVISAILFYKNYNYSMTIKKYKNRFKSLVIPYVYWNVLYTVFVGVAYKVGYGDYFIDGDFSWKNILFGILLYDNNKSVWFLFDLVVFTLLCPIIYTLMKNKYVGIVVITASVVLYYFNITVPSKINLFGNEYGLFWRSDALIFYFIGAYIGIHKFDWFSKKRNKQKSVIDLCAFLLCMVVLLFKDFYIDLSVYRIIRMFITIISCFSLWFAFDIFNFSNKPKKVFETSFMMYILNFYLCLFFSKIAYDLLPKGELFSIINFMVTVFATIIVVILTSKLMMRFTPKVYAFITGGR